MRIFIYLNLLTLVFFTIGIDDTQSSILKSKVAENHFSYVDKDNPNRKSEVGTTKAIVCIRDVSFNELQSTAASKVFMSTADAGYHNLSFRGRGTVIGTADRNHTAPPPASTYQPPRGVVSYTKNKMAYAGAIDHMVVYRTEVFRRRKRKDLEIIASGNESLRIDPWTSPSQHINDLDPNARAYADVMSPGDHFEPDGGTSVDTDNFEWEYNSSANLDLESTSEYVGAEYTITVADNSPTPSEGFAPASGSYTVTAGSTHTATVNFGNSAIYGAYLYVNDSSQWYSGSPSLTSLSMSYTFPSDASGSYTVSALVYAYNDAGTSYGSTTTYSYTVTVSSGTTTPTSTTPTTPSYHACGIHETSVSGDHSLQASCPEANRWGHSCTVTNYYACQTHTHTYPTFSCGRGGCTESVSDPEEHRSTCMHGIQYWSCKTIPMDMVEYTKVRICTREKALRQVWDPVNGRNTVVWGECGESYSNCHKGWKCRDAFGAVGRHTDVVEAPVPE